MEINQHIIKEFFEYKNGFLYWKKRTNTKIKIGALAGSRCEENRMNIQFFKKKYKASRLIFLYHKGYLPKIVDHENRDLTDDRIENLREANNSQNSANRTSAKNSSSQYLGVNFNKGTRGWEAAVSINNKRTYIGWFKNETTAALAYNRVAVKLYGEFASINIIRHEK